MQPRTVDWVESLRQVLRQRGAEDEDSAEGLPKIRAESHACQNSRCASALVSVTCSIWLELPMVEQSEAITR